jgi:hypothetical protein
MPPSVRAVGAGGNTAASTATTFSPPMPVGLRAGDLLIGFAGNGSGLVPTVRPSGSSLIGNVPDGVTYNLDIVQKVAVGSDVFTWTSGSATRWAGFVMAITAGTYRVATPCYGNVGLAQGTASTTFSCPLSTPTDSDSLQIAVFGAQVAGTWSTTNTNPTMTEICDTTSTGTGAASMGGYRSNTAPANAVALVRSAVCSLSSANGATFQMFVAPMHARKVRYRRPQSKR